MKRFFLNYSLLLVFVCLHLVIGNSCRKESKKAEQPVQTAEPASRAVTTPVDKEALAKEMEHFSNQFGEFMMSTIESKDKDAEATAKYKKIFKERLDKGFREGEEELEILVRLALSFIYRYEGNEPEAEKLMMETLNKFKGNVEYEVTTLMAMAQMYRMGGKEEDYTHTIEQIVQIIRNAIISNPENAEYQAVYFAIVADAGSVDEALKFFESLKKENPDVAALDESIKRLQHYKKEEVYRNFQRDLIEADDNETEVAKRYQRIFEERIKKGFGPGEEDEELMVYSSLARAFRIQGLVSEAEKLLMQGLKTVEGNDILKSEMLVELGDFYADSNRTYDSEQTYRKSIKLLRELIDKDPSNEDLHRQHMMLVMKLEDINDGLNFYRSLAEKYPEVSIIHDAIAELENLQQASEEMSPKNRCLKALEKDINDREAHSCVREAYEAENAEYDYLKFIQNFVNEHPDSYAGWFQLGYALKKHQKKLDEAYIAFEKAIELKNDYEAAYGHLAEIHLARKEWKKAYDMMSLAYKYEPERYFYLMNVYKLKWLSNTQQYKEALDAVHEFQNDPRFDNCNYLKKDFIKDPIARKKANDYYWMYLDFLYSEMGMLDKLERESDIEKLCEIVLEYYPEDTPKRACNKFLPNWQKKMSLEQEVAQDWGWQKGECSSSPELKNKILEFETLNQNDRFMRIVNIYKYMREILKLDPKCKRAHVYRAINISAGAIFWQEKDKEVTDMLVQEFCDSAKFLLSLDTYNAQYQDKLGDCYIVSGKYDLAIQYYQDIMDNYKYDWNRDTALIGLLKAHAAAGNCEIVESMMPQVKETTPKRFDQYKYSIAGCGYPEKFKKQPK